MSATNTLLLEGRLGSDPEEIEGDPEKRPKGKKERRLVQFDLAHQPNKKYPAEWHRIWCYGMTADIVTEALKLGKGDLVRVDGRINSRHKEGPNGERLRVTWITAYRIYLIVSARRKAGKYMEDEGPEIELPD